MSLLRELAGHPEYMGMLKAAEKIMPEIPPWDPANPLSVEDWKQKSAMRHGFELCLAVFRPK